MAGRWPRCCIKFKKPWRTFGVEVLRNTTWSAPRVWEKERPGNEVNATRCARGKRLQRVPKRYVRMRRDAKEPSCPLFIIYLLHTGDKGVLFEVKSTIRASLRAHPTVICSIWCEYNGTPLIRSPTAHENVTVTTVWP